jgi:hypothetical protein
MFAGFYQNIYHHCDSDPFDQDFKNLINRKYIHIKANSSPAEPTVIPR